MHILKIMQMKPSKAHAMLEKSIVHSEFEFEIRILSLISICQDNRFPGIHPPDHVQAVIKESAEWRCWHTKLVHSG